MNSRTGLCVSGVLCVVVGLGGGPVFGGFGKCGGFGVVLCVCVCVCVFLTRQANKLLKIIKELK